MRLVHGSGAVAARRGHDRGRDRRCARPRPGSSTSSGQRRPTGYRPGRGCRPAPRARPLSLPLKSRSPLPPVAVCGLKYWALPLPASPGSYLSFATPSSASPGPSPPTCDCPGKRPAPPGRLTPARVRRGFRTSARHCPARPAPKPGKPGPGAAAKLEEPPASQASRHGQAPQGDRGEEGTG